MFKYPFLDFDKLNQEVGGSSSNKLSQIYEKMGGLFHDEEKELMEGAVVGIVSVGGVPVEVEGEEIKLLGAAITPEKLRQEFNKTYGMSSFMSYLNPNQIPLNVLGKATLDRGHTSILHTVSLGVLVVGVSSGVEHEISSQRDIVHLSRLTVAKTKAQDSPCLVLRNPRYIQAYKSILHQTKHALAEVNDDDLEARNLLYPSSKASAVLITGSVKNFKKFIALKDCGGKEDEFIELLEKLENALSILV